MLRDARRQKGRQQAVEVMPVRSRRGMEGDSESSYVVNRHCGQSGDRGGGRTQG